MPHSTVSLHEVTDPSSPDLEAAGRLVGNAFMGKPWPNGLTPAVLQWRTQVLARVVKLRNAGKSARVIVAKDSAGKVVGVASWTISTVDDPSDQWTSIVPTVSQPESPEDMDRPLFKKYHDAFGRVTDNILKEDNRVDLLWLVVDPSAQRTGAGGAMLAECLREAGSNLPTFLFAAATSSAAPFYMKKGFEEVYSEELAQMEGFPQPELRFQPFKFDPRKKANASREDGTQSAA